MKAARVTLSDMQRSDVLPLSCD